MAQVQCLFESEVLSSFGSRTIAPASESGGWRFALVIEESKSYRPLRKALIVLPKKFRILLAVEVFESVIA